MRWGHKKGIPKHNSQGKAQTAMVEHNAGEP